MKPTRQEYESFVYRIKEFSKRIQYSDLVLIPAGSNLATLKGSIYFENNIRLEIREALDFDLDEWITGYGYVVYKGNKRQYWYDSQEHPDDPNLASTHPHHKHVPPNIKRNRIPAPNLSFTEANLPFLIKEMEKKFSTARKKTRQLSHLDLQRARHENLRRPRRFGRHRRAEFRSA